MFLELATDGLYVACGMNFLRDVRPVSHRHGPPELLGDFKQLMLLRLVLENPGIYLHVLQTKLWAMFEVTVSAAMICRTLKFMGCARQVIQHIAVHAQRRTQSKIHG